MTTDPRPDALPLPWARWLPLRYRSPSSSVYRHNLAVVESHRILHVASRLVAAGALLYAASTVLLLATPGGPGGPWGRAVGGVVTGSALLAAVLWWRNGWPRERTSLAFIAAAEVAHTAVLLSCDDALVAVLAAIWFHLIGDYLAFAHGIRTLVAHCAWVFLSVSALGVIAMFRSLADPPVVLFLLIGLWVALVLVPLLERLFSDALRSDRQRRDLLAYHDPLTTLLNRRGLDDAAPRIFGQARAEEDVVAVLLLDVDRFKAVNDTYGHSAGDAVLVTLAARLAGSVRKSGLVARVGGEEFVVLDRVPPDGIPRLAERLRQICANDSDQYPITVSVGAVGISGVDFPTNDPGELLTSLIIRADGAMYRAKQRGGNQVVLEMLGPETAAPAVTTAAASIFDRVMARRRAGSDRHS